jgi:diguanylate cyclase (GGDEF)-like protein
VNLGRGSALTLTHTDGTMLMRSPFVPGVVGRNVNGTDVFRKAMTAPAGTFEAAAGVDGINRLYTARAVEDLPLIVLAGLSTDELYAHWFGEVYSIGAIVLLLALATVGLAAFAARELRQRARAERRLTMLATTDALTGISNRRRFDVMLDREWKRARRQGASIALLMIDVDNFKGFNDRNGHLAGDRALARIAACIAGMTREGTDIVARYGGEEIVVLLPNLALDEAMAAAERMRIAVAELDVAGEPALPTVSIGVASVRPSGIDTSASLVAAADRALYQAKRRGRNRVESGAVSAVDAASLTQAA